MEKKKLSKRKEEEKEQRYKARTILNIPFHTSVYLNNNLN